MSTKIYNGKRIWASSLDEVFNILNQSRDEFNTKLEQLVIQQNIKSAINILDTAVINDTFNHEHSNTDLSKSPLSINFLRQFDEKEEEPYYQIQNIIFPHRFSEKKRDYYLFLMFSENDIQYSPNITEIEEYLYFNNTDKPEEISNKEWNKRKKDWDTVLPTGHDIPLEQGLQHTVARVMKNFPTSHMIEKHFSIVLEELNISHSLEKRVNKKTLDIVTNKIIQDLENTKDKPISMSAYINSLNKVLNNELTPELLQYKEDTIKTLTQRLPHITEAILKQPIEQTLTSLNKTVKIKP